MALGRLEKELEPDERVELHVRPRWRNIDLSIPAIVFIPSGLIILIPALAGVGPDLKSKLWIHAIFICALFGFWFLRLAYRDEILVSDRRVLFTDGVCAQNVEEVSLVDVSAISVISGPLGPSVRPALNSGKHVALGNWRTLKPLYLTLASVIGPPASPFPSSRVVRTNRGVFLTGLIFGLTSPGITGGFGMVAIDRGEWTEAWVYLLGMPVSIILGGMIGYFAGLAFARARLTPDEARELLRTLDTSYLGGAGWATRLDQYVKRTILGLPPE